MSDSVWPHRQQPTRLPRPWDSPGKNTGVGCHFLLQCMKVRSESEVAQSCPTLSDPMDCSPPGSSVHGIFQARVLEWVAIAFSIVYARPSIIYLFMQSFFIYSFTRVFMSNLNFNLLLQRKHSMVCPWTTQTVIQLDATIHVNLRYSGKSRAAFFLHVNINKEQQDKWVTLFSNTCSSGAHVSPYWFSTQAILSPENVGQRWNIVGCHTGRGGPSSDI